ncbi:Cellulose synthase-like protein [Rhynchospora pubera]|uniref:Cellulose synthase-like protein n=1 Tax=Rhynchospora pubera TaxID=906938 RepID=A0AAV8HTY1_9POAL|nr:Cellulose synthase-like protein [Rhynchospora pubera]
MGSTKYSSDANLNPPLNTIHLDRWIPLYRAHALLYSTAILGLIYHRVTSIVTSSTFVDACLLSSLLLSELVLAFMWVCSQSFKWRPLDRQEFLERLPDKAGWPALDVFVCTADPYKEPPIGVVSTALSALAFDYPAEKLSVYVSDDGGADVTLFAFMEGAKFARHWLPFCRENGVKVRSPEVFFASGGCGGSEEEEKLKTMYQTMKQRVESVLENGSVSPKLASSEEDRQIFKKWKEFSRNNHPSVIQVLVKSSKDRDITGEVMPNLIYFSREKRPNVPHHFKAGALNALLRASAVLTNAPLILTVDCDMYSTDPTSPQRALCYFLDPVASAKLAYVQFPQRFQGLNKSDIYGGELKHLYMINPRGMDGFGGPNYLGSNAFLARRALFDSSLEAGNGHDFIKPEMVMEMASGVAACNFESGTKWGDGIGFRYGSLSEDFHTGFRLQCEGWNSVFCDPPQPAFLGDAPKSLHDALSQCKRWTVGQFEVGFVRHSTLTFGVRKASLGLGLTYSHLAFWGIWCIPISTYALLPQLALVYSRPLFPKPSDPWFYLYGYLFGAAYIQDMVDFIYHKGTFRCWWSDQRMWLIRSVTSFTFGSIQFISKQLNISSQGFNVTSKVMDDEQIKRYDEGVFDFGVDSPFFVILGTTALLNLCACIVGIFRYSMVAEIFLAVFGITNCWPVYEAMLLRSDNGKMPERVKIRAFFAAGIALAVGSVLFIV